MCASFDSKLAEAVPAWRLKIKQLFQAIDKQNAARERFESSASNYPDGRREAGVAGFRDNVRALAAEAEAYGQAVDGAEEGLLRYSPLLGNDPDFKRLYHGLVVDATRLQRIERIGRSEMLTDSEIDELSSVETPTETAAYGVLE